MKLFATDQRNQPLAWRMMPESLDEFVGQKELLDLGKPLRRLIDEDSIVSLILYGPPGTGKTALARVIARVTSARFISLNAVTAGVKDIRDAISHSLSDRTIIFIDELHRFNRLQQDALLPHVESGEITLIAASTQNPYFALVPALASRSIIFEFKPLSGDDIKVVLNRALTLSKGLGQHKIETEESALDFIATQCSGDARRALNMLELAFISARPLDAQGVIITQKNLMDSIQQKALYYGRDDHYDIISAFIKSMRGSEPDASVYWLARMIASGEDPMFIARRVVVCASEDVGNADPRALQVAVSAMQALEKIGMPEGRIPLTQAVIYVATAPKSNSSYLAIERATGAVLNEELQNVPPHLRDAHYSGANKLGRGVDYKYPHNFNGHYVQQKYLEHEKKFYEPSDEGYERTIKIIQKKRRSNY